MSAGSKGTVRELLLGVLSAEYLALVAARRAARLAGNIKAKGQQS